MTNQTKAALILFASLLLSRVSLAQTLRDRPTGRPDASAQAIPEYLIYRHFLAWAGALDRKAIAAREIDRYKFAVPFSRARLRNSDLDVLRVHSQSLDDNLRKLDAEAKPLIAAFREKAKKAAQSGQNLPPVPSEIRQLQAKRTAIMVQHMISLQTTLGPQATTRLNAYLQREFVPHVSLKALAKPPSELSNTRALPTFDIAGE